MARSPLLHSLIRELAKFRQASTLSQQTGIPLDEVLDMQRDPAVQLQWDRRKMMQLGLLLGAAPVLARCGGATVAAVDDTALADAGNGGDAAVNSDKTVVIVGAGMAGLHCAYRLQKDHGIAATIYEAQTRTGGRMFTDRETFKDQDGMHCELGGELIDTHQVTMQDLAKELQLELLDYHNEVKGLDHLKAHFGGKLYGSADLLADWKGVAAKIDEAASVITDTDVYPTYKNHAGGEALDKLDLKSFLGTLGASDVLAKVLNMSYITEYGLETEQQSALNFIYLVSTATDAIELFGVSDERFHTKTGNDAFIQKLVAALPAEKLKQEHVLKKVVKGSDGRYVATFDNKGTAVEVKADHLVLTIPFTMLRNVDLTGLALPEVKKKAINELGYGTNAKLMVGFDSRPWREAPNNAGGESFSDLGFQCTWETSRLQSATSKAGIITNFTGGKHGADDVGLGTPAERASEFVDQYDKMYPGVKTAYNKKVARFHWPSHAWTKGSYQCYLPGQYTTIRGAEAERFENIHFCGEHTSLPDAGFMEGAAATGADVAADIAKDLGANSGGAQQAQLQRRMRKLQLAFAKRKRLVMA